MRQQLGVRFEETVRAQRLICAGDVVVAGVSGGPDSLALLHLLCRLRQESMPALRLIAAHLNHGLRAEARSDAAFVAETAARWGVEYEEETIDVPALRDAWGLSLEETGRVARYDFLRRVAWRSGAVSIATAHHADDQVESIVMHWLRGAGLAGLRGMQPASWVAELPRPAGGEWEADAPVRLIRPLLGWRRADIEAYCAANGLEGRCDRTNLDVTIFRNRLRHELIPTLESYNPNVRATLLRSAAVLARDYDYLRGQTLAVWDALARQPMAGVFQFDRRAWRALHPSLQAGLLREAVRRLRAGLRNMNEAHVDDALTVAAGGHAGQRATLPQGLMLTVGPAHVWVAERAWLPTAGTWPALESPEAALAAAAPGVTDVGDAWHLRVELGGRELLAGDWATSPDVWRACLDVERLDVTQLCLRARRPGDAFQPFGLGGASKDVREFLMDAKMPSADRARYPLVCAGEQIVWLPGLRLDERAKVQPESRRILRLTMRHEGSRDE